MIGSKRERVKGSGVWELRVSIGRNPVTGKYGHRSRTFKGTAAAADKALSRFHAELDGQRVVGSTATVNALMDVWLEVVDRDRSPTTAEGYRSKIKVWIRPGIGPIAISALTAADLDRLYRAMGKTKSKRTGKTVQPTTIRQVHAIISSALTQAFKWGWVSTNVAKAATPPTVRRADRDLPEVTEVKALALAIFADDPRMSRLIGLALKIGCRRGEICGLQWRDVDLAKGKVRIHRNVVRNPGKGLVVKDTKTHQERTVSIDDATVQMLTIHKNEAIDLARFLGGELPAGAFVFPSDTAADEPLDPDRVSKTWRRVARAAGLRDSVRLHDLRHLNATVLLNAGQPTSAVSYRLGHLNESTTTNIYSHVVQASEAQAAEVAGELL